MKKINLNKTKESVLTQFYKKTDQDIPVGSYVKVHEKVIDKEKNKSRIQVFLGIVIGYKGRDISKNIMVRKVSYNIEVVKTFPLYSPLVEKIEVIKKFKTRRAKLYYILKRSNKKIKLKQKI